MPIISWFLQEDAAYNVEQYYLRKNEHMQWICLRKWTIFGRQSSVDECCHCCEFQEVNSTEYCGEHEYCVLCEYCAHCIVLCSKHKCFVATLKLLPPCYFHTRVKCVFYSCSTPGYLWMRDLISGGTSYYHISNIWMLKTNVLVPMSARVS